MMEIKERIIKEATQMFATMGVKSVRMDDIAAECGISKRTIYELFSSREELMQECMEYYMNSMRDDMAACTNGAENVIDMCYRVCNECDQMRAVNARLVMELKKFYPSILRELVAWHHKDVIDATIEKLRGGVAEGLILDSVNIEYFAHVITGYSFGVALLDSGIGSEGKVMLGGQMPNAMMIMLRGMATEKGRRYIDEKILKIA